MISKQEFINQVHSGQNQYTYFIMAIDASGIAFALSKLDSKVFTLQMILFFCAIISWGLSFFSGIRFQQLKNEALQIEYYNMDMREEDYPEIWGDKTLIKIKETELIGMIRIIQSKMHRGYVFLNNFMILGIIFFAGYEIWEMIIRSISVK